MKSLLARSLEQFGDKFLIKHVPNVTQNSPSNLACAYVYFEKLTLPLANAQIILLAAGQLNRLNPLQVHQIGRTSVFLNAVSNRLAASSNRSRFLGMIVGTGISQLMEEPGKAMRFDLEEMHSEEALWYMSLTTVQDKVGPFESIKTLPKTHSTTQQPVKSTHPEMNQKPNAGSNRPQTSKIVAIEEINDSGQETDEDDDLLPYEKPDDDREDEDEDPTLVQRNKPSAPV